MSERNELDHRGAAVLPPLPPPTRTELILLEFRGEVRERLGRLEERQEAAVQRADERFETSTAHGDQRHAENQQVLAENQHVLQDLAEKVGRFVPRDEIDRRELSVRSDMRRHHDTTERSLRSMRRDVDGLKSMRTLFVKVVALATAGGALIGAGLEFAAKHLLPHGWPFR